MKKDNTPLIDDEIEYVSKSEMKREAQRMHEFGQKLCELPPARLVNLPISDTLAAALRENTRLTSNEAKRRHLNYIGKTLRDEDIDAIQAALDLFDPGSESYGRIIKQQELWRERLVNKASGVNDFIEAYPLVDRQQLRNLVRNSQKELAAAPTAPSASYKKLFQFIKQQVAL